MREIKIYVYRFDELSKEAQNVAYNDFLCFIEEVAHTPQFCNREYVKKARKKCEELKTPWFFKEYLDEFNRQGIIQELKNNYEFYADGSVYSAIQKLNY